MGTEDSDASLVAAAQAGDHAAFATLVRRYQGVVFAVALRLLGDRDAAEDIVQEAFVRAYFGLDRFRGTNFRAWVLRIAHNAALDHLRAARRHPRVPLERAPEPARDVEASPGVEHTGLQAALEAALALLPPDQRAVVLLVDVEGLPYDEVAEVLEIPVGTVKSRLARARVRLRQLLEADPRARELLELSGRLPQREPGASDSMPPME
ncbi:MAG: sigma-70 family RNA polymerase sigma factor [Thermomicrobium sp.]|nr:sigma-70 family RNA polymerase sigma factor [Thermomicrobium sp.]MDW8059899.1 sigma-70 family RNA polymerase sigma factor [Thermomicrobium sp.]